MKQIKTVTYNVDFSESFDKEVNELLLEGWELKRRDVVQAGCALLYAELENDLLAGVDVCCENCKYCDLANDQGPCGSCSEDADKWEPHPDLIEQLTAEHPVKTALSSCFSFIHDYTGVAFGKTKEEETENE